MAAELSRLQDDVAPAEPDAVRALIEAELGSAVDDVFADLDWEPIAAASIGQAHRARLRDGRPVIVKVQRPGIAEMVARDTDVLETLARTVSERAPWAAEYHVLELTHEFTARLREELDYRTEADHAVQIAANLADFGGVHIPEVHRRLSTARVLVMEWIDGVPLRRSDAIDALGVDREELADTLLRCFLQQMLVDGHFHADPHPGNIMVLADGRLVLIDFGAAARISQLDMAALRDMLVAVGQRSAPALREAITAVATLRPDVDDDQFERALARFMGRHLGPGQLPSAAMFTELLQLFFAFGISMPTEFSTMFRALGTLEGTLTTLCPGYATIDAAQRIAGEWARERLRPSSLEELARGELVSLLPTLRRIPRHVDRIATGLERGALRAQVSLLSQERDVAVVTRLVNRVVLAFLGGIVGLMSVWLISIRGGPPLTGGTSLFEFFGYFGLFCATILILRVLVAVVRDGFN
jgi:ubiquinone biosynthesis protein